MVNAGDAGGGASVFGVGSTRKVFGATRVMCDATLAAEGGGRGGKLADESTTADFSVLEVAVSVGLEDKGWTISASTAAGFASGSLAGEGGFVSWLEPIFSTTLSTILSAFLFAFRVGFGVGVAGLALLFLTAFKAGNSSSGKTSWAWDEISFARPLSVARTFMFFFASAAEGVGFCGDGSGVSAPCTNPGGATLGKAGITCPNLIGLCVDGD